MIRLRDQERLTYVVICERARITRDQLISVFNMMATEDTLRKLDAFLDAPKLHKRERANTITAYEIENLSRELWREFRYKSPHPERVAKWNADRQRLAYNRMTMYGKLLYQKKVKEETQLTVRVPDGATYWQYKEACIRRIRRQEALRPGDRDARRIPGTNPVRQDRQLLNDQDKDRDAAGVLGREHPPA